MENKDSNTFPCRLQEIIDTFCEGKNRVNRTSKDWKAR